MEAVGILRGNGKWRDALSSVILAAFRKDFIRFLLYRRHFTTPLATLDNINFMVSYCWVWVLLLILFCLGYSQGSNKTWFTDVLKPAQYKECISACIFFNKNTARLCSVALLCLSLATTGKIMFHKDETRDYDARVHLDISTWLPGGWIQIKSVIKSFRVPGFRVNENHVGEDSRGTWILRVDRLWPRKDRTA